MTRVSRRLLLGAGFGAAALPICQAPPANAQQSQIPGKIAFIRDGAIWAWTAGGASEVVPGDNISDPRWSPDGTQLLYVRGFNSYSDLYVYDLVNQVETQLTYNLPPYEEGSPEYALASSWVMDPDWAQTGLIGFVSDMEGSGGFLSLWLLPSLTAAPYLALSPGVEDDISGLCMAPNDLFASYTVRVWAGDGTFETYVALRDLNFGTAAAVAMSSNDIFDSAISPDGAWVAVTIRDESETTDLWIVERASGERDRVTRDQNAVAPRWSSDGQWFGFMRMENHDFEIWVAQFAGGRLTNASRIYDEDGIDPQSSLSWWIGSEGATPGA